jgi:oligopeptide transport system permease protein
MIKTLFTYSSTLKFIIHKLLYLFLSLFLIVTLTFFLMKAIPGDPFTQEQALPKEIHQALRKHYGLEDPWYKQYAHYLHSVITWDLGPSFKYKGRSVNDIINTGFPVSAILGLEALFLALTLGIIIGSVSAVRHRKWEDEASMIMTGIGLSIPSFILATLLQYLFAYKLGIFPIARWGSFMQSVLPAISLAALPAAFIARLVRSNLLEVLQQDYIKTAKAKGLNASAVIIKHGLRNALMPVLSYMGQLSTNVLVGSFVIEKIFSIPGLGYSFVSSVSNRDYTVIMGTTVFYSIILLSAMFIVEIAYGILDPRLKSGNTKEILP